MADADRIAALKEERNQRITGQLPDDVNDRDERGALLMQAQSHADVAQIEHEIRTAREKEWAKSPPLADLGAGPFTDRQRALLAVFGLELPAENGAPVVVPMPPDVFRAFVAAGKD